MIAPAVVARANAKSLVCLLELNKAQQHLAGITPGLVCLLVGIETINDIIADIKQALDK